MRIKIFSYSRTGTNDILAEKIASELSIQNNKIIEKDKSTYFRITIDMLLKRFPKISIPDISITDYDLVLIIAPVWFGKPALPLKSFFKEMNGKMKNFIFISLSGGGEGINSNPKLSEYLEKKAGITPIAVINKYIADFLPQEPKPSAKEIENYKITESDFDRISSEITKEILKFIPIQS